MALFCSRIPQNNRAAAVKHSTAAPECYQRVKVSGVPIRNEEFGFMLDVRAPCLKTRSARGLAPAPHENQIACQKLVGSKCKRRDSDQENDAQQAVHPEKLP